MTHLDQDAAGRLLDRTSDRTTREMTVRVSNYSTEPGLQIVLPMLRSPMVIWLSEIVASTTEVRHVFGAVRTAIVLHGSFRCAFQY